MNQLDERIMDVNHPNWTSFINKLYELYIRSGGILTSKFLLTKIMLRKRGLSSKAIEASLKKFESDGYHSDYAVLTGQRDSI